MLTIKAPAKLNLVLEILGRRKDGYHEIKSIMQTVSLFDVLSFEPAKEIQFSCSARELQGQDNLVFKAAHALKQASGFAGGVSITLEKQIPWAAGLGGGSSDAAATLIGLNRLWSLGLPRERLAEIAAGLGSDVPFFIFGGTCLSEGRGERLTRLPDIEKTWFVLLKPAMVGAGQKTARLYGLVKPEQYTKGEFTDRMRQFITSGGEKGHAHIYNAFEHVIAEAYPGLDSYRSIFSCAGATEIHLAGSGPVLFTAVQNEKTARDLHEQLATRDVQSFLVSSVTGEPVGR